MPNGQRSPLSVVQLQTQFRKPAGLRFGGSNNHKNALSPDRDVPFRLDAAGSAPRLTKS